MSRPRPHGLTRSVQDRLRNLARGNNRPYAETLHLWALERFLYRLSRLPDNDRFVLKGALMMRLWQGLDSRPTRDIDLLGPVDLTADAVERLIHDSIRVEVEPDGLDLDPQSIRVSPIRVPEKHVGFRAKFDGFLARSELRFQVDIGTGDPVVPDPVLIEFPTLLDFPSPRMRAYTPYTSIAEKFQALVKLEMANTRMKDYFDLAHLAGRLAFDGQVLSAALTRTFEGRGMVLPKETPPGLEDAFAESEIKTAQWQAFVRKSLLQETALSLSATVTTARQFLMPAVQAAAAREPFAMRWTPSGPWRPRD